MEVINLRTIISSLLWVVCAFIFMPESGAGKTSDPRIPDVIPAGDTTDSLEAASVPEATQYVFNGFHRCRSVLYTDSEKYKPYHPAMAVREIPVTVAGAFSTHDQTILSRRRGAVAFVEEFLQSSIPVRAAPF